MALLVSAGLLILVGNAVADVGTFTKAVSCIDMHLSICHYNSHNMGDE
jgi:hypothetical protein